MPFVHTRLGVTGSNFETKPEPRHPPAFGLHFQVRAGHASHNDGNGFLEFKMGIRVFHYLVVRGATGSNFDVKPERRRMPGFGLHHEVRAGHAELSVCKVPNSGF